MLSTDDAGQADLLNSIVTITDLLSHDDHKHGNQTETLTKLIEAIARLKGVLISHDNAVELFGESGGFESLLKAVENGTLVETTTFDEERDEDQEGVVDATSGNEDVETPHDDKTQLRKELLQLTFAALSQVLASNSNSKEGFARIDGYTQLEN